MKIKLIMISIATIGIAVGCGFSQTRETGPGSGTRSVTVKGSDTMVHLVTTWAENYMKANIGADVSVTGGGSGTGIAALLNGTTDICAASREMTAEEKAQATQKGITPKETVVARDGIAVIVHPSNPVNELTLEQLKKIYTGAAEDWSQFGGPTGSIVVLSRESSSGTYVFFQEHVLKKEDYTPKARLMAATSAIIQSVSEDGQAIGYVGLGYALEAKNRVKVLKVKADDGAVATEPSEETVRSGAYSISRPLYFYTRESSSESAAQFVQFCIGERGQQIVRETGYVPVH